MLVSMEMWALSPSPRWCSSSEEEHEPRFDLQSTQKIVFPASSLLFHLSAGAVGGAPRCHALHVALSVHTAPYAAHLESMGPGHPEGMGFTLDGLRREIVRAWCGLVELSELLCE